MDQLDNIKWLVETKDHYARTRNLIQELRSIIQKSNRLASEETRIDRALDLMLWAHFHQKDRPDGQPYINHPLDVTLHLVNDFQLYEPEIIVAALLHDTVEDQAKSILIWDNQNVDEQEDHLETLALQIIQRYFGEKVSELVAMLTNPDFSTEAKQIAKTKEEEDKIKAKLYLEHFENIYKSNVWAFALKMADFSQNALHIDVVAEGPKKDWFRKKYGPVILMVIQKLQFLEDSSHPLFKSKEKIIEKFSAVYMKDYDGAI